MRPTKKKPFSLEQLRRVEPRATALDEGELVSFEPAPEAGLPVVARPASAEVDLAAWAAANGGEIDRRLRRAGALLFRGFDLASVADFERFATAVCPDLYGEYGDLPSEEEGKKVYRSTPYPRDKVIHFHNESSHQGRWPLKQLFFCVKAAAERGETPIVDCRRVYAELEAEVRDRFERLGLIYHRTFLDGLDVDWRDFFKTGDRAAVEAYCRRSGIEFEWLGGDGLRTRQRCRAVAEHPHTGERVFFNQVQLHHAAFLEPDVRASLVSMYGEESLPRNVTYGDGSPIEDEVAEGVADLYWRLAVQSPWREGDVLLVDNMLVAHARNPFAGERKIVVAMGEIVAAEELEGPRG